MTERVAIVVIGMHRSGSSAMARLLSLAGAALPNIIMPATDGNETGHWEPQRVADYNDTVLAAFDATWDSPFGLGMNANRRAALKRFVEGARGIIRDEYGDAPLIVLKEPRISLVADLWINALEAEGFLCKFVITVRPPTEVAASLRKRNDFVLDKGLLLWGAYQASSELLTRSYDRIFCRYDDVLARPASVLDDIEAKLRIELPRRTAQAHAEMDAFVRPHLKRHDASTIPKIPAHLRPITELSDYIHASIVGDLPNIDKSRDLQKWFSDLDQTITPLMIGLERRLRAEHETKLALADGERETYRAELERINALYAEQLADLARLNAQFAESEDLRRGAEHRVTVAEDVGQATQQAIAAHEQEKEALRDALAAANVMLNEVSGTLESQTPELARLRADIDGKTAEINALSDANGRLEAANADAAAALAAQSAETARVLAEVDGLRAQWSAREAEFAALSDERSAALAREDVLAVEAAGLREAAERAEEAAAALRAALEQAAAHASDERDAALARERSLVSEAAGLRDGAQRAEDTAEALRVALKEAQDHATAREAELVGQIDILRATVSADAEREATAAQTIAALTARNDDMARIHAEEVAATAVQADEHHARLLAALEQASIERDQMRAENDHIRTAEATATQSLNTLMDTLAQRDDALEARAGEVTALNGTIADLKNAIVAQTQKYDGDERSARERENTLKTALASVIRAREDEHAERRSIVYRMKSVFVTPKTAVGDQGAK